MYVGVGVPSNGVVEPSNGLVVDSSGCGADEVEILFIFGAPSDAGESLFFKVDVSTEAERVRP